MAKVAATDAVALAILPESAPRQKEEPKANKYKLKPVSRLASEYEKVMQAREMKEELKPGFGRTRRT